MFSVLLPWPLVFGVSESRQGMKMRWCSGGGATVVAHAASLFSFPLTFESWETLCPQVSHKIFLARWCYKL